MARGAEKYDAEKFRELTLYIAARSETDAAFGAVKLNKLLFYADFLHYAHEGRSITGARYQHLPQGPAPFAMLPVIQELEATGDAVVVQREYYGKTQDRLIPRRPTNPRLFSGSEIAYVEKVIRDFWGLNATEMSDRSHREMAWRLTENKQEIPYELVFLSSEPPTDEDVQWAMKVAKEHGISTAA